MIPTILYAFDTNPLIASWNKKLAFVTIDGVRFSLIDGPSLVGEVDVYRRVVPFYGSEIETQHLIEDGWTDKMGCYTTLAQVLEKEEHLNSKVTFLKPLRIESNDAIKELEQLGGNEFILRPNNGTRSIDAFRITHNPHEPFRLKQFMSIYANLYAQRSNDKILKEPIIKAFEICGVRLLSNTTWQEFRTSMGTLSESHHSLRANHFFLQKFETFDDEYRIIKAAPGKYFGYKYPKDRRGWEEDLHLVRMKPLSELLSFTDASELMRVFEDKLLPFMCSIDIGVTKDAITVHEYSPEFMTTEYSPFDLHTLVESHLRGIKDLVMPMTELGDAIKTMCDKVKLEVSQP